MTPEKSTRTTRYWLDDEGFLRGEAFDNAEETLADARDALGILASLAGGVRRPMVTDISRLRSISRDARNLYAGAETAAVCSALALVVASPLSRAIGNFFLGLSKPITPTRLVGSPEDGLAWLREQRRER